jgi:uncharacterized protein (DUF4415 family)/HEPN domain-containing protein
MIMKTVNSEEAAMRSEYDFSKGQRGRYVGRIEHADTDPRNCKVSMIIKLDADIVEHFKNQASESGAASIEDQVNDALRQHIDVSAAEHLDRARRYLARAKECRDRGGFDWAAWDLAYCAISEALSAAVSQEQEKGYVGFAMTKRLERINVARRLEIISEEQWLRAQHIIERVPDSQFDSMSPEDSEAALCAAEDIIKTIEQRINAHLSSHQGK